MTLGRPEFPPIRIRVKTQREDPLLGLHLRQGKRNDTTGLTRRGNSNVPARFSIILGFTIMEGSTESFAGISLFQMIVCKAIENLES